MRLKVRRLWRAIRQELPIQFGHEQLTSYGGLELVRRYFHLIELKARIRRALGKHTGGDYGGAFGKRRGRSRAHFPHHQSPGGILMVTQLKLGDIAVNVVFKDIRHIHLSVHPPAGTVRISAPRRMGLDPIRLFAISKLDWIKKQQRKLRAQERETPREYLNCESHYAWGKRYLLKIIECDEAPSIELKHDEMILRLRPGNGNKKAQAVVAEWYREQIREAAPPLIAKWEPVMGVKVARFFVRHMKTRWGSCSPRTDAASVSTPSWPRNRRKFLNTSSYMKWPT
jgi:predicted metal-dependent hydrolase